MTGRAGGTTGLIVLGLAAPLLLGLLIDRAGITTAVHGVLAAILAPVIVLLLLSLLLGRAGRFARTGISLGAGIGRMNAPRRGGGGPGCALLVRHPQGETRVLVALDLDIPLGRTVTVRGPVIGGHLQAWRVQVVGVDDRAFLCRGVAAAVAGLSVGGLCCLIEIVGAIAR